MNDHRTEAVQASVVHVLGSDVYRRRRPKRANFAGITAADAAAAPAGTGPSFVTWG